MSDFNACSIENTKTLTIELAKTPHLVRWVFNAAKISTLFAANMTSSLSKTTRTGSYSTLPPTPRPLLLAVSLHLPTLDLENTTTTRQFLLAFLSSILLFLPIFLWIQKAVLSALILSPRQLPQDAALVGLRRNPSSANGFSAAQKPQRSNHPALCNR